MEQSDLGLFNNTYQKMHSMIHESWQWFTFKQEEYIDVNRGHLYTQNYINIIQCNH